MKLIKFHHSLIPTLIISSALLTACDRPKQHQEEGSASASAHTSPAAQSISSEGMWQPSQLPALSDSLKTLGLKLDPESMTKLTDFPMNAVISLGNCSASFVSPKGLVITNHHCAYGSISYNSTEKNDLLENGFLAESLQDELPAAPGSRVYVTVAMKDVTDKVMHAQTPEMDGRARQKAIENAEKSIVSSCEEDPGHRCEVYSYYGGLNYYLVKQLEIRDVRLVHAPPASIGKFGGDIDNWMWPRHTGDYSFYRAYVDKQGKPADFSKDNVPYQPKHYLPVASKGPNEGDYVMVAGYPGRTYRYRLAEEVNNTFSWYYPTMLEILRGWSDTISAATNGNKDAELKYASLQASLKNASKNFEGMLEGYQRSDLLSRKHTLESELQSWVDDNEKRQLKHQSTMDDLNALIETKMSTQKRDRVLWLFERVAMLDAARQLYRLSLEHEKPDMEREPGYQERDLTRFKEKLKRIERSFTPEVDKAMGLYVLDLYSSIPQAQHIWGLDKYLGNSTDREALAEKLDGMYAKTSLTSTENRLSWIGKDRDAFQSSKDPFIQLAVAMHEEMLAIEEEQKALDGQFAQLRPQFMELLIEYNQELGKPVYPDANGSLRVSFGTVKGYTPPAGTITGPADGNNGKDGFVPFTTLRGILAKHNGKDPFNAPQGQLDAIKEKQYGAYYKPELDSVPVNYLTTLDITGGNSGSPTMNANGELVGLAFDGTYDSINADWDFSDNTRAIHVDIGYILWNMEYVSGAYNLLDEMGISRQQTASQVTAGG